jgi:hypothetical protein
MYSYIRREPVHLHRSTEAFKNNPKLERKIALYVLCLKRELWRPLESCSASKNRCNKYEFFQNILSGRHFSILPVRCPLHDNDFRIN